MLEDEQLNNQGGFGEKPTPPPLEKNQKIAAISLAVFAVLVVALWFAQLKNNIYGPFNTPAGSSQTALSEEESQAAKDAALKAKDTDGDGLFDYDELNTYKTSPYLTDTDGDGFKDNEEIAKGFDPNCPQGRTCAGGLLDNTPVNQAASASSASGDTLNNLLNQFGASQPATQSDDSLTSDQLKALKNMDAAGLRELLLQNGMDKATLDKISDTDLLKSFEETLSGQ